MEEMPDSASLFDLRELQISTLTSLAVCTGLIGWAWLTVIAGLERVSYPAQSWIGSLILLVVPPVSLFLRKKRPTLASVLLIVAIVIAIALGTTAWRWQTAHYLYLVPISFAGALLGQFTLSLVSCLCIALTWFGIGSLGMPNPWMEASVATGVILLVAGASWLSLRNLRTALQWLWHAYGRVKESESMARQRRADLRRALDALTEASRRLDRTNRELLVARREAEEARVLQEHFVANVSHEIRTPLNLVVGFGEMLYLSPESYPDVVWTPDLIDDIGAMYRAGRHLQSLIDDVLDLSRINAARLPLFREATQLVDLVHETVEAMTPLFKQHGLTCTVSMPQEIPELFIDRTRIRQVLVNLLNNAVRYTDSGEIDVSVMLGPEDVTVVVRDTGMGIPEDQLERIFEEFRQVDDGLSKRGGAGLGLAISRQFVQLHGGDMWATSVVGEGSTFHFTLPLPGLSRVSGQLVRVPDRRDASLADAPIIVVDRDPSMAQMLSRYVGDHRVLSAPTVAESDDLIALEHPMAVVVNQAPGSEPLEWLGATGPSSERWSVPTIRCAIPSPSWLAQATGIKSCLTKPIAREELLETVRQALPEPGVVLVVDDDHDFVNLVSRMLKGSDRVSKLITAYGGAQALELIDSQSPDLVLLDLVMPEVDGFDVIDRLHAQGVAGDTNVVAISATSYAEATLRRRGGYYTITQTQGLDTAQMTELIRATLRIVRPDYLGDPAASQVSE